MERNYRVGKWVESLVTQDINQIWKELHRMVSSHPLVRASKRAGFLVEEGQHNSYTDLTQELFVTLLAKDRFQHYLETGMSNSQVESEISQIELTNMLTAQLRKRYPESYRMARRVSTLVQTSKKFKRFNNMDKSVFDRLANRQYGLTEWPDEKASRDMEEMRESVKEVSFHSRDIRMVGCTGDVQLVIDGPGLEDLVVKVLKAVDSPIDIRSLRSFVMSRLPIMDIHLASIRSGGYDDGNGEDKEDRKVDDLDPVDMRETPEQNLLRSESEKIIYSSVEDFLENLDKSVRRKSVQYQRMLNVLWYCYLISDGGSQLEVAEMLGVSDSLVSDYRKRIAANLELLSSSFDGLEEARKFEEALKIRVQQLIIVNENVTA